MNSEKERYEKRIKELEEKIKKLEQEVIGKKEDEEKAEESGDKGAAAGILESLGKSFGLGGLLKGVSKMPEFQKRLEDINEELRTKLKETPLKRTGGMGHSKPTRVGTRVQTGRIKKEPHPFQQREADIFDEVNYVLVIIEIPGADEKSIKVNLEKDKLTIIADKAGKKYHRDIILPCVPEGETTRSYKNGILEVKIFKSAK